MDNKPYNGEIQWLTPYWLFILFRIRIGILRVWEKDKKPGIKNKQEYLWASTVRHVSNNELEIMGVDKAPTIYIFKEIVKTLISYGYKTGFWTRINTDKERVVRFTPKERHDISNTGGWNWKKIFGQRIQRP